MCTVEETRWEFSSYRYRTLISNSYFDKLEEGDFDALASLLPENYEAVEKLQLRCEVIAHSSRFRPSWRH